MEKYSWGHNRRFNSYPEYFKKIFGERIQKVSVNAGFSCPNRDGSVSIGGCIFCDNNAFNPSYCSNQKTIIQQIDEGILFHKIRYRRANKYLVYFQAFSNTYASIDILEKKYNEALNHPEVIGLIIGTRPDCVNIENLSLLKKISKKYFIAIEFGVESTNNKSLEIINRGHTFEQAVEAIELTAIHGLNTGGHFIFGLPEQTFHQLQILKNTKLFDLYENNEIKVKLFELDEYIDFIIKFTERLNPTFIIERFNAEVPPRYLQTKPWGELRLFEIQRMIEAEMEKRNTWQGKYFK